MAAPSPERGVRGLGQHCEQDSNRCCDTNTDEAAQTIRDQFALQAVRKVWPAPWRATPCFISRRSTDAVQPLRTSAEQLR